MAFWGSEPPAVTVTYPLLSQADDDAIVGEYANGGLRQASGNSASSHAQRRRSRVESLIGTGPRWVAMTTTTMTTTMETVGKEEAVETPAV